MPKYPSSTAYPSRRGFLGACAITILALAEGIKPSWAMGRGHHASSKNEGFHSTAHPSVSTDHPEPRPGIDASRVLTPDELADAPHAVPIYDKIRQIPEIADGIYCHCGCASLPGFRSLLVCYEANGMAKWCEICQGEGNLTYRLHTSGKSLDQIRTAIDAKFG